MFSNMTNEVNLPRIDKRLLAVALVFVAGLFIPLLRPYFRESDRPAESDPAALAARLDQVVRWWQRQLPPNTPVIAASPLVIAGDLPVEQLERWRREALVPLMATLEHGLPLRPMAKPLTVMLLSSAEVYRDWSKRFGGVEPPSQSGHFSAHLAVLYVNVAAGRDAVCHEATHGRLAADFSDAPAWLDEGIASLMESYRVVGQPPRLEALANWRLPVLRKGLAEGRVPPLSWLLQAKSLQQGDRGLNYAYARYYCMYLLQKGRLAAVYAAVRDRSNRNVPLGNDEEFRRWVAELPEA